MSGYFSWLGGGGWRFILGKWGWLDVSYGLMGWVRMGLSLFWVGASGWICFMGVWRKRVGDWRYILGVWGWLKVSGSELGW